MHKLALYSQLNELADSGGLVIFGGKTDQGIPMCELKQAFHLQDKLYNRSIDGLSVHNGAEYFDACVAPLKPKDVLLRIGEADREFFAENAAGFDKKLSALLRHMRNNSCIRRIALISGTDTTEMNTHLAAVAKSEGCEFCDISHNRLMNPQKISDDLSFVYAFGFVRPLNRSRPLYDLAKILFCYA